MKKLMQASPVRSVIIVCVVAISIVGIFAFVTGDHTAKTSHYKFSTPYDYHMEFTQYNDYTETLIFDDDTCMGGVDYYQYTDNLGDSSSNVEDTLIAMGVLETGETLDAYMMDSTLKSDPMYELWEIHGESEGDSS